MRLDKRMCVPLSDFLTVDVTPLLKFDRGVADLEKFVEGPMPTAIGFFDGSHRASPYSFLFLFCSVRLI